MSAALVFVAVGLLPVLGGAVGGRWDLPSQGVEQPLAFLARPGTGVARVLWLGDPRALPAGGWSVQPGLAYALTPEDLPDAAQVFTPAGPGPAGVVANAVRLAVAGGTVHLGRLLAPPACATWWWSTPWPRPWSARAPRVGRPRRRRPGSTRTSSSRTTCRSCPGELGVQVFENGADMPVTATRAAALPVHAWSYPSAADVGGLAAGAERALAAGRPPAGAGRHRLRRLRARPGASR